MKKQLFFILTILLLFVRSHAQITITSASMPSSGDTIRYSTAAAAGITYAPTGTNYFWDYSNLIMLLQDVYQYKAAAQTPYAFYFIGFNKYGRKVADSIGVGTFKFYDVYNFYTKTSLLYKTEGVGFKYNGLPLASYYTDDDELYQFPLNYNDRDSSTYAFSMSLGTGLSYSQKGYRINEVDGWGTIKTPFDSVACLRLITTSYGIDSINVNGFGFSFPNVQRSYQWLSTTQKIPMLEITGQYQTGVFTPNQVRYRDIYRTFPAIGIKNTEAPTETMLYPNPSDGNFNVQSHTSTDVTLKIHDLEGKEVYNQNCTSGNNKINPNSPVLSKGLYIVTITDNKGNVIMQKKVVIE